MNVRFAKMHGAGNDFVIIDGVRQSLSLRAHNIRFLADRQRGIGCDQVLLVEPPDHPDADFRYRIFNADGSEAGQCGNGARCFARFIKEQRLSNKRDLVVQTLNGNMGVQMTQDGRVLANLGTPVFEPAAVPFTADTAALDYEIQTADDRLRVGVLSVGNPHVVLQVPSCKEAPVTQLGPVLEAHERFPERVNVGFMELRSRTEITLRVFERGAGETLACGTGACAAAIHGMRLGLLDNAVTVQLPGGKLSVNWAGEGKPVWLGGPTATVFEGDIRLRQ